MKCLPLWLFNFYLLPHTISQILSHWNCDFTIWTWRQQGTHFTPLLCHKFKSVTFHLLFCFWSVNANLQVILPLQLCVIISHSEPEYRVKNKTGYNNKNPLPRLSWKYTVISYFDALPGSQISFTRATFLSWEAS